jgi:uncharacterized protein (DUF2249 family)
MTREGPEREILLDVRGLPPCEPLELALAAVRKLGCSERVRLVHWREPFPLYELLKKEGFAYDVVALEDRFEIVIWRQDASAVVPARGDVP